MNERLLYIGAEKNNEATVAHLRKKGYQVRRTLGLRPSLRALANNQHDAVIIDLGDVSMINARRISRKAGRRPEKPFTFLLTSHRSQLLDGFFYDDKLTRPFTQRKLENLLRRYLDERRQYVVRLGPLTLDKRTQVVRSPRGMVRLTRKQFQLLDYFFLHVNELVTRRDLMMAVWETDYLGDTRTLDVHMRWLRQQIEADPSDPEYLVTERGSGYRLCIPEEPEIGHEPLVLNR